MPGTQEDTDSTLAVGFTDEEVVDILNQWASETEHDEAVKQPERDWNEIARLVRLSNVRLGDVHEVKPGNILVVACRTPQIGKYHWIVYLCETSTKGYKYHATNRMGTQPWAYEYGPWNALMSTSCIGVLLLGRMPEWDSKPGKESADALHDILKNIPVGTIPGELREEFKAMDIFTCRVWCRKAMTTLNQTWPGICPDAKAAEWKLSKLLTGYQWTDAPLRWAGAHDCSLLFGKIILPKITEEEDEDEIVMY